MRHKLKTSRTLDYFLTFALAGALMLTVPMQAQAGVLGKIGGAAKSVGGAIKSGAGSVAKVVNKVASPVAKVSGKVLTPVYNGLRDRYGRPFYQTGKAIVKKF